jgi:SpoIID/LytB domain protein
MLMLVSSPALASNDELIIEGSGWGHGIGMSQYGAYGRALAGHSAADIIEAYYTGATVGALGGGGVPNVSSIFTNVGSDVTSVVVRISYQVAGDDSGTEMSRSDGQGGVESASIIPPVDGVVSAVIVDSNPNGDGGCSVTGVVTWAAGSCDISFSMGGLAAPDNLMTLDPCRGTDCTFGYGAAIHLVDNSSLLATGGKRVSVDTSCNNPPCDGFDLVVESTLDEYTYGIDEMPFSWGIDGAAALEAQAIAARSYAAAFAESKNHEAKGCYCDVYNDTRDQNYDGWISGQTGYVFWEAAVTVTANRIVTHPGDSIIAAYYSSANGGRSMNNEDYWSSSAIAWLRSVEDPFTLDPATGNPNISWQYTKSTGVFESRLGFDEVYEVRITQTYDSGSPSRVAVTGRKSGATVTIDTYAGSPIDGVLLKNWFGLKSAYVTGFSGDLPEPPPVTDIDRWWGANRYNTAVEISKANFPSGADSVVIATGLNYPDALAAASFAAQIDAPVLLVAGGTVPGATIGEVQRLNPTKIYILGGTVAVPQSAENVLDDIAPVTRLAGSNRYGTAIQISKATHAGPVDTVYLAPGTSFVEALVAGPVAASSGNAILLVPPTSLPGSIVSEIQRLSPSKIVVVGGGKVISQSVVDQLAPYADSVVSIAGNNRYHTAVLVSKHGFPSGADTVLIATGVLFPDALSGGGVAGNLNAPILLVEPGSLPSSIATELLRLDPATVWVLGGPEAISDSVVQQIIDLLD